MSNDEYYLQAIRNERQRLQSMSLKQRPSNYLPQVSSARDRTETISLPELYSGINASSNANSSVNSSCLMRSDMRDSAKVSLSASQYRREQRAPVYFNNLTIQAIHGMVESQYSIFLSTKPKTWLRFQEVAAELILGELGQFISNRDVFEQAFNKWDADMDGFITAQQFGELKRELRANSREQGPELQYFIVERVVDKFRQFSINAEVVEAAFDVLDYDRVEMLSETQLRILSGFLRFLALNHREIIEELEQNDGNPQLANKDKEMRDSQQNRARKSAAKPDLVPAQSAKAAGEEARPESRKEQSQAEYGENMPEPQEIGEEEQEKIRQIEPEEPNVETAEKIEQPANECKNSGPKIQQNQQKSFEKPENSVFVVPVEQIRFIYKYQHQEVDAFLKNVQIVKDQISSADFTKLKDSLAAALPSADAKLSLEDLQKMQRFSTFDEKMLSSAFDIYIKDNQTLVFRDIDVFNNLLLNYQINNKLLVEYQQRINEVKRSRIVELTRQYNYYRIQYQLMPNKYNYLRIRQIQRKIDDDLQGVLQNNRLARAQFLSQIDDTTTVNLSEYRKAVENNLVSSLKKYEVKKKSNLSSQQLFQQLQLQTELKQFNQQSKKINTQFAKKNPEMSFYWSQKLK